MAAQVLVSGPAGHKLGMASGGSQEPRLVPQAEPLIARRVRQHAAKHGDGAEAVSLPRRRKVGCMYTVPHMRERGTARLDERGRLVLPAEMRRRLGLQAGDVVSITEEDDGVLRVESRRAAARALLGIAGSSDRPSLEGLKADRRRQLAAEHKDAGLASSPTTARSGA